jgi:hypothetical protein
MQAAARCRRVAAPMRRTNQGLPPAALLAPALDVAQIARQGGAVARAALRNRLDWPAGGYAKLRAWAIRSAPIRSAASL